MEPYYTFHHELQNLNKKIMQVATLVEERLRAATNAITTRDEKEIQRIILTDYEIDDLEVEIEEDCLKILALHQPVASDLRFIIAVIKINNEIERIGDMAVNLAIATQHLSDRNGESCFDGDKMEFDFPTMSERAIRMLRTSLDALVERDARMARKVFHMDDEVDRMCGEAFQFVRKKILEDPAHPGCHINVFMLAKTLERVGDRSINIAEEVIHLVEGTIVRNA